MADVGGSGSVVFAAHLGSLGGHRWHDGLGVLRKLEWVQFLNLDRSSPDFIYLLLSRGLVTIFFPCK